MPLAPFRDLGLTYSEAAHGVQSAVSHRMWQQGSGGDTSRKHLRTGLDLSKAEQAGFARLLIDKGVFTLEEYEEYMRLAVNEELAKECEQQGIIFR